MRALVAASATAALLLTATPAAHAETWRHTDATGDVHVNRYHDADGDGAPDPVEAYPPGRGDLTNLSVRYDADELLVAATIPEQTCASDLFLRVVTSRGDVFVFARRAGATEGCYVSFTYADRRGSRRFTCEGLRINRTAAGIVAHVPRRCLDSAYRVRVGVQLTTSTDNEVPGDSTADDGLRTSKVTVGRPRLGPWIVGSAA